MFRPRYWLALLGVFAAGAFASAQSVPAVIHLTVKSVAKPGDARMPSEWTKVDTDLNIGSGGNFIYLFKYHGLPSAKNIPITGVMILEGQRASAPPGWEKINVDLNHTVGGAYLFLAFKRSATEAPIEDISVVTGNSRSAAMASVPTGWKAVDVDLNKKAGGKFVYLTYRLGKALTKAPKTDLVAEDVFPDYHTLIRPKNPILDTVGKQVGQSCQAWATCAMIGTVFMRDWYTFNVSKAAKVESFIHKSVNLLDAQWFYDQRGFSGDGWNPKDALDKATQITIPFKTYPEYGIRVVSGPATDLYKYEGTFKPKVKVGTRYGGFAKVTDHDYIRKEISLDRPYMADFRVFSDFQDNFKTKNAYLGPKSGAKDIGGHAVMVVGYNKPSPGKAGIAFWECQNSWGQQWGKNGYFAIGTGVCDIDSEMYVVYNCFLCDRKGNRLSLAQQNEVVNTAISRIK